MALVQPKSKIRGVLTGHPRVLGAPMTATSQAGPRPGVPVPGRRTSLTLEAGGTLDQALSNVTVATARAGSPGTGGATLRWKYAADSAFRSWDPPTAISEWEFVDRSTVASKYASPHAVRLPDTGLLLVSVTVDSTSVAVWRQTKLGKWASVTIEDTGGDTVSTLCVLPSGRVVCIYTYDLGAESQYRMAYSDDSGDTWTVGSEACLPEPSSIPASEILRLRAFCVGNQVGLLTWSQDGTDDTIQQRVSNNGGCTFSWIETFSSQSRACPDVKVHSGTAYVATIEYDSTRAAGNQLVPFVRKLTSAAQNLSGVEATLATNTAEDSDYAVRTGTMLSEAECALLVDDDGVLWLYGRNHDTGGTNARETFVVLSQDDGANWYSPGISSTDPIGLSVHWSGDTSTYFKDICVVPERGRAVLFHMLACNPATHDDSLCAAYLGGWSSVGMPEDESLALGRCVSGWDQMYVPADLPANTGTTWTETTTGAPSTTLTSTGCRIATSAAEERTCYTDPGPFTAGYERFGIHSEVHVQPASGTALHDFRIGDGSDGYSVRVSVTTTAITLRDMFAGADIATAAITGTDGVAFKIALDKPSAGAWTGANGRVRVWYRTTGPYLGLVGVGPRADRQWTHLANSTSLVSGTATTRNLQWGISGSAGEATWRFIAWSAGAYNLENIADSLTGAVRGRTLTTSVAPIHLAEGLRVHGSDGPTVMGDTWTLPTVYEHPVDAIDPSLYPSPRRTWRSTTDTIQQDITWTVDLGIKTGDLIGIYLDNANFRTATLYRDAGGANKIADIDMATGLTGLSYTRVRDCLYPTGGGGNSAAWHFHEGILAGAHVDIGGGVVRKIRTNTAGGWLGGPNPASYASARIYLEEYDAADPVSGTMQVILPRILIVTTVIQGTGTLMLRIPVQDTWEGYHQLGTCLIGRMNVLAHQHGRDWAYTATPNYLLSETRSGARRGRRLGPMRPSMDLPWSEGVGTAGLYSASAADHLTIGYSGADAVAAYSDTPRTLAGIIQAHDGPVLPVVLATAIPQRAAVITGGSPLVVNDPTVLMYGRFMTESLRLDNVVGEEDEEPGPLFKFSARFEGEV